MVAAGAQGRNMSLMKAALFFWASTAGSGAGFAAARFARPASADVVAASAKTNASSKRAPLRMGISNDLTGFARSACIMHKTVKSKIVQTAAINSPL